VPLETLVLQVQPGVLGPPDLTGLQDRQVRPASREVLGSVGLWVIQEVQDQRETQDQQETRVHRVLLERQERMDRLAILEHPAALELQELKE